MTYDGVVNEKRRIRDWFDHMNYITLESVDNSPLSALMFIFVSIILVASMIAMIQHAWDSESTPPSTIGKILSATFIFTVFMAVAVLLIHLFVEPSFDSASRNEDAFTNAYGIDDIVFTNKSDYWDLMSEVRTADPGTSFFTATDKKSGKIASYKVVIDSRHHLRLFVNANDRSSGNFVLEKADYHH